MPTQGEVPGCNGGVLDWICIQDSLLQRCQCNAITRNSSDGNVFNKFVGVFRISADLVKGMCAADGYTIRWCECGKYMGTNWMSLLLNKCNAG